MWLRQDGTPYYVGKGHGTRAFIRNKHRQRPPSDTARIILQECESEQEAFDLERFFISFYERLDLGTGCLRNLTDGGEGSSGFVASLELRAKLSKSRTGRLNHFFGRTHSANARSSVAESNKKRVWTPESRAAMSRAKKGRKVSTLELKRMRDFAATRTRSVGGLFA
jgi:hypothetical protein